MSHKIWKHQVSQFAGDYRVIALDLRGHGQSDKPFGDYSLGTFADDLHVLCTRLSLESITLIGWSLGAQIVAKYLCTDPPSVKEAVLISSSLFDQLNPDANSQLEVQTLIEAQKANQPDAMKEFVDSIFGEGVTEVTKQWVWSLSLDTAIHAGVRHLRALEEVDYKQIRHQLQSQKTEAMVMHGTRDEVTTQDSVEYVAEQVFSKAKVVTFENSSHVPFIEEPNEFEKAFLDFISR